MRQVRDGLPPRRHSRQGLSRDLLAGAPESFKSAEPKWKNFADLKYTLQVAPEDCTGCGLCIEACPSQAPRAKPSTRPSTWFRSLRFASAKRTTGTSSSPCRRLRASSFRSPRSRTCNCSSRSSSSPEPAADAVKPRTSSCSHSFTETARSSPTPPVALRSTAAICPPRLTPSTRMAAASPGPIRSLKTTLNSVLACVSRSTKTAITPASCWSAWRQSCRKSWSKPSSARRKKAKPRLPRSASASSSSKQQLTEHRSAGCPRSAGRGRHAGGQGGLDRRWRWLGL